MLGQVIEGQAKAISLSPVLVEGLRRIMAAKTSEKAIKLAQDIRAWIQRESSKPLK